MNTAETTTDSKSRPVMAQSSRDTARVHFGTLRKWTGRMQGKLDPRVGVINDYERGLVDEEQGVPAKDAETPTVNTNTNR